MALFANFQFNIQNFDFHSQSITTLMLMFGFILKVLFQDYSYVLKS